MAAGHPGNNVWQNFIINADDNEKKRLQIYAIMCLDGYEFTPKDRRSVPKRIKKTSRL